MGTVFPQLLPEKSMPTVSGLKQQWFLLWSEGNGGGLGHDILGITWTGNGFMRATSNEGKDYVYQEWGDVAWVLGEPVGWTNWFKGDGLNRAGTKGYFQGISSAKQISRDYNSSNMGGKTWFGPWYEKEGMPYAWDRLSIVAYFRSGCSYPRDNYVIDDVYLAVGANSAARVEIGNKSVYTSCTKMAISTPTSWSDGRINFTVREGNFQPGEKAFVFVVDSNNNFSAGYPVTFMYIIVGVPVLQVLRQTVNLHRLRVNHI